MKVGAYCRGVLMQQESSRQIFREEALNKAFATDELDKMMQVTKPAGWLALSVMGVIIIGALAWAILGHISVRVPAGGIILDDVAGTKKAVLFLPLADKDRVKPGMTVQITPAGFSPQEYGYLLGAISEVGKYSLTTQNFTDLLGNDALTAMFSSSGPRVMATVELYRDAKTGGYAWTAPSRQPAVLTSETLLTGNIVVDERRPAALLLSGS